MRLLVLLTMVCLSCQNTGTENVELEALKNQIETLKNNALTNAQNNAIDETAFIHTVFFWFKKDVTEAEKAQFASEGLAKLTTCKSIYKGYYGLPAHSPRDVVDNSYGYALNCHFKSAEDEEIYQNDPQHLKFIDTYKHLWDRVIVYDNLVAK